MTAFPSKFVETKAARKERDILAKENSQLTKQHEQLRQEHKQSDIAVDVQFMKKKEQELVQEIEDLRNKLAKDRKTKEDCEKTLDSYHSALNDVCNIFLFCQRLTMGTR